jgi:L-ascorbate metabolism protein UlaG (beta-lactamase superfamily)
VGVNAARIRFVGHSTVLIEVDGVRVLTDPLLRRRVAHLRRDSPVDPGSLGAVDVVLVSHAHRDHLDLPSLGSISANALILVPRGLGSLLSRRGHPNVTEVAVGDTISVRGVELQVLPAVHDGRRMPFSHAEHAALGYAVLGSQRTYFAGDTELFDAMSGLVPDLDLALVPIWGWGPTLGRGAHLDPATAAQAVARLRPRIAIPIHWGTYAPLHHAMRGVPGFLSTPPGVFADEVARESPDTEVRILMPGEETTLDPLGS